MIRRIIRLAPILCSSPSIASDVGSRARMPMLAGTLNGSVRRKPTALRAKRHAKDAWPAECRHHRDLSRRQGSLKSRSTKEPRVWFLFETTRAKERRD